ncbi:MAG: TonB-dependent receptor [Desulfobacterales bacterium]
MSSTDQKTMVLESIVVIEKRTDRPRQTGDADLESTPAFFSLIERNEFEGKMESLAEVIEKETGVQVRQSGGLGSFSSVSLRGSTSEQVMVFLDGILLNDASGGGVDLSVITLSDVESIEVFKGITPANFSKASVGGAINIRTNRIEKGFKGSVSAGYGSFDTKQGSLFINHKPSKWDYLLSADILDTKNDFEFVNDKGTKFNTDDDEVQNRNNAAVKRFNLLTKVGYDISNDVRLELNNQWFSKDQELPTWNNSPLTETTLDTKRNVTTLGLKADNVGSLGLNTHFKINYSWKEEIYDDSDGFVGLGKQKEKYTTRQTGGSAYAELFKGNHLLSLFTEYNRELYELESLLQEKNASDSTRDYISTIFQDSWIMLNDQLILTPAMRYTWIEDELDSATSIFGLPLEGRSRNRDYFTPQLGVKYRIFDWLTLKTNWAEYVREPSFFELFGDRGFFIGNKDLKAEKGTNFDCGLEIDYRMDRGPIQRVNLETAYFYSEVDDLITRTFDARGVGKSVNISGSTIDGVEAGLSLDFLNHFRLIGRATWQDPVNESQVKAFDGKRLPGRYEEAYMGRIEVKIAHLKLYAEKKVEKGIFYDTANLLKAEDKDETNLGATLACEKLTLVMEVRNIEDNQYEDFNGFPLPGRFFSATLKITF